MSCCPDYNSIRQLAAEPGCGVNKPATKYSKIKNMLLAPGGTTVKDILGEINWPSISMPATAAALGLKLTKWNEGGVLKYKGTSMSAEEIAEAKAAAKEAKKLKDANKLVEALETASDFRLKTRRRMLSFYKLWQSLRPPPTGNRSRS
jgi:hypothetical protein